MATVPSIAFNLRTASKTSNFPFGLGHAQQILAAALGYGSLAALQAEPNSQHFLDDTQHVVIDQDTLVQRLAGFQLDQYLTDIVNLIKATLEFEIPGLKVHRWLSDFDEQVRIEMENAVSNAPDVSGLVGDMGLTWCTEFYPEWEEFEIHDTLPPIGSLLDFNVPGHMSYELNEDRGYTGHGVAFTVAMFMLRTAKRCFGPLEFEVVKAKKLHYDDETV